MSRRTIFSGVLVSVSFLVLVGPAGALTTTFFPSPPDLYDLPHSLYRSWGIAWQVPEGEEVVDAVLAIEGIDNWTWESSNHRIGLLFST